ncbi:PREDICTED: probable 2-oxoglutarate-dependent dioxygenase AOP1 [Tarenaya hassleriana]|uniref:probable 2-oxoglutarate-dependent dioxygenase AOP1 n=1 Tax=Tarenaya hassleriana TaxID=28532 RepID=UPI00053C92C3|nr:PREDICTED: probable 2-oxoglutarate-dependent dioxygenase AOP1 [Tarenaya hassleriana]
MGSLEHEDIPIVDFSGKKMEPGTSHWTTTRDIVRRAMEEQGWFVIEYDGVGPDLLEDLLGGMKEMYELPYGVKIKNENHKASHGYMSMVVQDYQIHESLGIDYATQFKSCLDFSRLLWPDGNDPFCETTHSYAKTLAEMDRTVMRMLYESYGMDEQKHLETYVESTRYLLRLLSYRKQRNGAPNTAFVSHTDKSFTTILHQNHVLGLQLRSKSGEWIQFEPSPTRFVFLAGMGITAWSNDRIKPCYHRVVMSADEVRYSMGFFSFHKDTIRTPEELVDDQHPPRYNPFEHDGLLRFYELYLLQKKTSEDLLHMYCGVN